jgi:hypothetical protein
VTQDCSANEEDSLRLELPEYQGRYYEIEVPVIVPENCRPNNNLRSGSTYEVALFLPLFVYVNDTLNKIAVKKEVPDDMMVPEM